MAAVIDYFVTSISPWTYFGHRAVQEVAARHGATLQVRPVNLGEMFKISGQVPLADRAAVRQRYRMIELQRFAEMRGRKVNLHPKHFPTDPTLADHAIIAVIESGADPLPFMDAVFSAVWADDLQIADTAVISGLLGANGLDADTLLQRANTPEITAIRSANTQAAIAADATGVPAYVLNGEPFWGQDRIEMLDRALAQGRAPFKS
ncbi:MAG: 2-hydroxychromene-2-carboxylate isomerase [Mesorhizobium sp.]